jgi:hypothetical protein
VLGRLDALGDRRHAEFAGHQADGGNDVPLAGVVHLGDERTVELEDVDRERADELLE